MSVDQIEILKELKLKDNNILEKVVEGLIVNDPSVLPLGKNKNNIKFVEKQKYIKAGSKGFIDLILKDEEKQLRYTVEITRGELDETHIVRLISYWDREKKKSSFLEP